jgi:cysteine desulfurase
VDRSSGEGGARRPIYLDHHATTPADPRVLEAMWPYFAERFGNAASRGHAYGWEAEAAVEVARERVAVLLGASPAEIVFTSGATESNNLAIQGIASAYRSRGDHLVTTAIEHASVLDVMRQLERVGYRVSYVWPGPDGRVAPEAVAQAVTEDTVLVSAMLANNEIGVIQPVAEIAAAVKAASPRVLVHTDAAQAASTVDLRVHAAGVDLISLSAHKMYGPKGVGALWVRRRPKIKLEPLLHGGGHERGLRPGTLPVPLVVGFGVACELAQQEGAADAARIAALRDRLRARIASRLGDVRLNGAERERLPGNLHLSFDGVEGDALLLALRDVALSSGAACASATLQPSHVLRAIGVSDERAHGSLRFGLGRFNTGAEIDHAAERVVEAVMQLRRQAAVAGAEA